MDKKEAISKVKEYGMDLEELPEKFKKDKDVVLEAILNEDMFLAGGIIFLLSLLTVIGTLLSDILLALIDPRIRYE